MSFQLSDNEIMSLVGFLAYQKQSLFHLHNKIEHQNQKLYYITCIIAENIGYTVPQMI